jgi:hypothetical protein
MAFCSNRDIEKQPVFYTRRYDCNIVRVLAILSRMVCSSSSSSSSSSLYFFSHRLSLFNASHQSSSYALVNVHSFGTSMLYHVCVFESVPLFQVDCSFRWSATIHAAPYRASVLEFCCPIVVVGCGGGGGGGGISYLFLLCLMLLQAVSISVLVLF